MKIISLNLHCLKEENMISKLSRVKDFILENDIDICLFQEAAQHKDNKIIKDNIREGNNCYILNSLMNNKYHMYFEAKKIGFDVLEEGLAILSKEPLDDFGYKYISKSTDFYNWQTRILIYGKYKGIMFYDIHLGWTIGDEIIENQIDNVFSLARLETCPVMIFGDYNCCHNSKPYKYFLSKGFYSVTDLLNIDIINNPTFNFKLDLGDSENRVIDHILMNKRMSIKDYQVVFRDNPVSDHNLIYVEVLDES